MSIAVDVRRHLGLLALLLFACPAPNGPEDGGGGGGTTSMSTGGGAAGQAGGSSGGGATCLTACPLTACGDVVDGCGGVLRCGGCPQGESCGGGGLPNVCAAGTCVPVSCQSAGKNCGQLSDGCGLILECGQCTGGQTCGAQTPNVCGVGSCTPKTCAELGKNCGMVNDGCGRTLACGACARNESCGASNVCQAACPHGCPAGSTCDARGICTGATGAFAIDLISHTVEGTVTVNGVNATVAPLRPSGTTTQLFVHFTDKQTGAVNATSISCSGSAGQACPGAFSVKLFPGAYRVTVFGTGLAELPNVPLQVGEQGVLVFEPIPELVVSGPLMGVALNLVTVPVRLTFTINGARPLNTTTNPRNLTLTAMHTGTGQRSVVSASCAGGVLGTPCDLVADARLPPGPHRVMRLSSSGFPELPIGADVPLESAPFMVAAGVSTPPIDLPAITVRGTLTLNGAPAVTARAGTVAVGFTPSDGGSVIGGQVLCATPGTPCNGAFDARLSPGTYRVTVQTNALAGFPAGGLYVADPALTLTSSSPPLTIDVPTVRLDGNLTVNGSVPSPSNPLMPPGFDLQLTDALAPQQRSTMPVDCTLAPLLGCTFSDVVFRGRVLASVSGSGAAGLPPPTARSPALPLDATAPRSGLAIDLRTTTLQGAVTVNGSAPTVSPLADGGTAFGLRLSGPGVGELVVSLPCPSATPGSSCPLQLVTQVYQGTTLGFEASADGFSELPRLGLLRRAWPVGRVFPIDTTLAIASTPVTATLDVKTARLTGTITVNGATPERLTTLTLASPATLQLTNKATGAITTAPLSCAPTPASPACALRFDELVPRGVYELAVVPRALVGVSTGLTPRWIVADAMELR